MATRDELVQAVIDGQMFVYSDIVNLAPGAVAYAGFLTGSQPVMVDRRTYGSTLKDVTIRFYENTTFTGGTPLAGTNRDRTMIGITMPEPQAVSKGITPGTLPAPLFQVRLLDANVLAATFGDLNDDRIRLAKLTSYVLSVTNNDTATADFSWAFLVRSLPS